MYELSYYSCLWFYLESLINKTDNFEFLSKLLETIKLTVDAEYPDDMEINKVSGCGLLPWQQYFLEYICNM